MRYALGIVIFTLLLPLFAAAQSVCPSLSRGSTGLQVIAMQKILYAAYANFPTPTGYFGPTTQAALKQWQKEHGIQQTGTIGPKTGAAMKLCGHATINTNTSSASPQSGQALGVGGGRTASTSAAVALQSKREQAMRAYAAIEPSLVEEFKKLVTNIRTSSRTDIPNLRVFANQWSGTIDAVSSKSQTLQLQKPNPTVMDETALDTLLATLAQFTSDKQKLLAAYNGLPIAELSNLEQSTTSAPSSSSSTTQKWTTVGSITLVSPNGGEQVAINTPFEVKWKGAGIKWVEISLFRNDAPRMLWIARNVSTDGTGSYTWDPTTTAFPTGAGYKIQVNAATVDGYYVDDMSDAPFSFYFSDELPALYERCVPVTFTLDAKQGDVGGDIVQLRNFLGMSPGNAFTLNMVNYVKSFQKKYASEILTPQGLTQPTGTWGSSERAKANAINAKCGSVLPPVSAQAPSLADLKVNGSDGPIILIDKQSITVSWSSSGATSCSIHGVYSSSTAASAYITDLPTSGSREVFAYVPDYSPYSIYLICNVVSGTTVFAPQDDSVSVTKATSASVNSESEDLNLANALTALESALRALLEELR